MSKLIDFDFAMQAFYNIQCGNKSSIFDKINLLSDNKKYTHLTYSGLEIALRNITRLCRASWRKTKSNKIMCSHCNKAPLFNKRGNILLTPHCPWCGYPMRRKNK